MLRFISRFFVAFLGVSIFCTLVAMTGGQITWAQQQQQLAFPQVPIVLDAQKFQAFYQQLIEIEMKPKAFNQIIGLIQQMEMRAVEEKAKSDAAAKTEKP